MRSGKIGEEEELGLKNHLQEFTNQKAHFLTQLK